MPADPKPADDPLIESTDVLISWADEDPAESLDVVLLDLDDE